MILYHFFDYKYNISGFKSDLFSIYHLIFIGIILLVDALSPLFIKRFSHKHIRIALKVLSIFTIVLEIAKISFESYFDISTGRGFNSFGILPLYTCSLYIYTLFIHAFTKGKPSEYSLSFLTTTGMLSGLIGLIYCNGLNWYPFWTFGAFYSLFFHSSMFLCGIFLLVSGYKKLEWKDVMKGWVPVVLLSLIAIPVNYGIGSDYIQIYEAGGVPLMENLAKIFINAGYRQIFTILMIFIYILFSLVVVSIYKIIEKIKKKPAKQE